MAKFLPGLFIGAAIGLLIAPKKGDEMRLELSERWKEVQHKLSGSPSSGTYNRSTTNNDTDPITLRVDTLESAKPSTSPLSDNGTQPSSFNRTSADSVTSTEAIMTPVVSATASIPTTPSAKPYIYLGTTENAANAPTSTSVETLEEIPAEKDTTPKKRDTPYQNSGKSSTASRWLNNNNQHRRGQVTTKG